MSKWKVALATVILGLTPSLAQAHALTGSGGWLDELVCLVPAAIMVVLVFALGRTPKSRPDNPGSSPKSRPAKKPKP